MNWHFSLSISSWVRWAPTAGLSWSSRKSTSTFRPRMPPLAFSSTSASWAPRCMSAARAPKGPVSGSGTPMRIGSLLCARRTAGKARVAAPRVVVVRKERRSIGDLLVCG